MPMERKWMHFERQKFGNLPSCGSIWISVYLSVFLWRCIQLSICSLLRERLRMMGLINIAMIVWLLGVVALQSILGEVFIRDAENEFVAVETFSNNVNWFAPFYTGGGYSSEAISFVKALDKVGVKNFTITQHGDSWNQDFVEGQEESERRLLAKYEMLLKTVGYPRISICHSEPGAWYTPTPNYHTSRCPNTFPHKDGHLSYYKVGRTMFETDRLPSGWLPRLQYMDELWVPTEHMRQIFLQHDVPAEKLHVIEEAVDTDLYQPLPRRHVHYEKYQLQALRRLPENFFVFLFVGKFEARKGMDILLEAYLKEFHKPEDNVVLVLLTGAYHSSPQDFEGQIQRMLREKKVDSTAFSPNYIVLSQVQANAMPVLYSFADALVVPSHGEGWGRPHMEAMACGTPVIATNWSGPTAFINESTGYLLEIEDALVDAPYDHSIFLAIMSIVYLSRLKFYSIGDGKDTNGRNRRCLICSNSCAMSILIVMKSERKEDSHELLWSKNTLSRCKDKSCCKNLRAC